MEKMDGYNSLSTYHELFRINDIRILTRDYRTEDWDIIRPWFYVVRALAGHKVFAIIAWMSVMEPYEPTNMPYVLFFQEIL